MARIIVVDDDPGMLKVVVAILERAQHLVTGVSSGRAALKLILEQDADLLVTDLIMPDIEGVELIQQVRRTKRSLPIISISGGGRIQPDLYLKLAERLGANAVLPKPFPAAALLELVSKLLLPQPAR